MRGVFLERAVFRRFSGKKQYYFSRSSRRAKNCGKNEKNQNSQGFPHSQQLWKIFALFTAAESGENNQRNVFGFPQKMLKKRSAFRGNSDESCRRRKHSMEAASVQVENRTRSRDRGWSCPPLPGGNGQCLELILVFSSLTVSAKTGFFFIFFSTCWME